jgi:hypothetical protein
MDKPLIGCIFFHICAVPCRVGDLPPNPGGAGCEGTQLSGCIAKPRAISVAKRNYPE